MGKREKKVNLYIASSASFAQPILSHLRQLVHDACPDVEETIKWGFPNYVYKGILCNMAAFKQHCSFGFWKASLMSDSRKLFRKNRSRGMGDFGKITSLADLPPDRIILSFIKEAMRLNEEGTSILQKTKTDRSKSLNPPAYFLKALEKNKKACNAFENFSYSNKREYVEWITEAKTEATRTKRLGIAIEWMAEGKIRNWKYSRN